MYTVLANLVYVLIFANAGACVMLMYVVKRDARDLLQSERNLRKRLYTLDQRYTVLISLISVFTLLGMLGTVLSLLGMDLSGDAQQVKSHFFTALGTTAAGIVFAVGFKIVIAFSQSYIESQIEKGRRMLGEREKSHA